MEDEPQCPEVIITAGGTREPIDDVRCIANFSGGKLGHALAGEYARLGHSVLLLAPKEVVDRHGVQEGVEHETFMSAEDLRAKLLSQEGAKLVLQAAAVADWTPRQRKIGKMSSTPKWYNLFRKFFRQRGPTIRTKPTPKILPELRQHFGEDTKIIGFKLLSGVEESQLIGVAAKQIKTAGTDLCVANDLQELGSEERRLHIVQPGGGYETLAGSTEAVAAGIANAITVQEEVHA